MKNILSVILAGVMLFAFAACGNTSTTETSNNTQSTSDSAASTDGTSNPDTASDTEQTSTEPVAEKKILVVYFSRTGEQYTVGTIDKGNTAIVSEMIAEKTGADLYEILPETDYYPYTYGELTDVAKHEQNENARPKIKGDLPDVSQYDTIFIGAPVWWGDWPMICYTFFESVDMSGKKLVPFSTHEGSGLSGFDKKLASAVPGAEVLIGQAFRGTDCQNNQADVKAAVDKWIGGIGY
ncbi:MAG: flavodoxin [Clostridia bacterium]|nr:flavodoxin [Clostridia bacterium]